MKVPFIDLQQRYHEEKVELVACVEKVLARGDFIGGEAVGELERQIAAYSGTTACVALNSGTDALMIGMMALGIGRGDEVITPPNSFVASTAAIVHIGATPVFADVRDDQNIDPADVERRITSRTKAIMPVHWTGRIADMDAIMAIAEKHGLLVIEDAAQAMGAYYRGRHAGSIGAVGCFSAHPLKNFNAIGDGGFLVTNDVTLVDRMKQYRNHGLLDRDTVVEFGVNSRLDTLHAEVLLFRLQRLKSVIERRRRNVALYRELLSSAHVFVPSEPAYMQGSYTMFIVQCDDRDRLHAHLNDQGIQSLVYYRNTIHLQPAAAKLGYKAGDMPVAERQGMRVLALPHHQGLEPAQIEFVATTVNRFYGA
jgi:dTDP-4-amino-4,6-dideoxygalactose transaminase